MLLLCLPAALRVEQLNPAEKRRRPRADSVSGWHGGTMSEGVPLT